MVKCDNPYSVPGIATLYYRIGFLEPIHVPDSASEAYKMAADEVLRKYGYQPKTHTPDWAQNATIYEHIRGTEKERHIDWGKYRVHS